MGDMPPPDAAPAYPDTPPPQYDASSSGGYPTPPMPPMAPMDPRALMASMAPMAPTAPMAPMAPMAQMAPGNVYPPPLVGAYSTPPPARAYQPQPGAYLSLPPVAVAQCK